MALFAIQLVRLALALISVPVGQEAFFHAYDIVIAINQMLNVNIIRSIHFYFSFVLLITFT